MVHNNEVDDAVYSVALQRYILARLRLGEQVSELAAARIADLARDLGLSPSPHLKDLGFRLSGTRVRPLYQDTLIEALRLVRRHRRVQDVHALCNQFVQRSVAELEHGSG